MTNLEIFYIVLLVVGFFVGVYLLLYIIFYIIEFFKKLTEETDDMQTKMENLNKDPRYDGINSIFEHLSNKDD